MRRGANDAEQRGSDAEGASTTKYEWRDVLTYLFVCACRATLGTVVGEIVPAIGSTVPQRAAKMPADPIPTASAWVGLHVQSARSTRYYSASVHASVVRTKV